ncbi:hypothetical protein LZ30DRAFT_727629 [Colletotrichum cereale]|nr:hypothetical protein LZ30DRAFT_727629 [Colletotrichum cereale]
MALDWFLCKYWPPVPCFFICCSISVHSANVDGCLLSGRVAMPPQGQAYPCCYRIFFSFSLLICLIKSSAVSRALRASRAKVDLSRSLKIAS